MRLLVTGYLRPEEKYSNLQDLIKQIHLDVAIGRSMNEKICNGDVYVNPARLEEIFKLSSTSLLPTTDKEDERASWQLIDWQNQMSS